MAATYVASEATAKDRVRGLIWDVAAPFRFQNETIGARLTRAGFSGDPLADSSEQEGPELLAAIRLVESVPGAASSETTVRQGSVSRTTKGGTGDYTALLATLRQRYAALIGAGLDMGVGIAVVQPDYPEVRRCEGWSGFGLPTE